jgi:hypothetical protein
MVTASFPEIMWALINAIGLGYGLKIWRQSITDYNDITSSKDTRAAEKFQAGLNKKIAKSLTLIMLIFLGIGLGAIFIPPEGSPIFGPMVVTGLIVGDLIVVYILIQIDSGRSKLRQLVTQSRRGDRKVIGIEEAKNGA